VYVPVGVTGGGSGGIICCGKSVSAGRGGLYCSAAAGEMTLLYGSR